MMVQFDIEKAVESLSLVDKGVNYQTFKVPLVDLFYIYSSAELEEIFEELAKDE